MAEGPAGDQRGESMNTQQDLLIQQEQPLIPEVSLGISSPGSSGEAASLNLAAAAAPAPAPGRKKPGYYSENGYLMETKNTTRNQEKIQTRWDLYADSLLGNYRE